MKAAWRQAVLLDSGECEQKKDKPWSEWGNNHQNKAGDKQPKAQQFTASADLYTAEGEAKLTTQRSNYIQRMHGEIAIVFCHDSFAPLRVSWLNMLRTRIGALRPGKNNTN